MSYKFLNHTADIKIKVSETSLERAFETCALAMKEVIVEKLVIKSLIKKQIEIHAKDEGALLYDFLEEFLFLLDSQSFIFSEIKNLKITNIKKGTKKFFCLKCDIFGDKTKNYKMSNDVKAITYNEMKIINKKGKVIIEFVLDV
jgi:SHS2 domain-containing protein